MSKTRYLATAGHLSATLQTPIGEIRKALDRLGVKPALVINGLEHYDEAALIERGRMKVRRRSPRASSTK